MPSPAARLPAAWLLRRGPAAASAFGTAADGAGKDVILTLERSVGDSAGSDLALRSTGAFYAEVVPDLPAATTWRNWLRVATGWVGAAVEGGLRYVVFVWWRLELAGLLGAAASCWCAGWKPECVVARDNPCSLRA